MQKADFKREIHSLRWNHSQRFCIFSSKPTNMKTSVNFFYSPSLRVSSLGRSYGGAGKGRRTCNYFSGICIEKVDAKCWYMYPEMILVMTLLPLARRFQCLLHSRSFPLRADWRKSDSSFDGEPQGNWRWNSNSRDVVVNFPSFSRPAARAPLRACSQAIIPLPFSLRHRRN